MKNARGAFIVLALLATMTDNKSKGAKLGRYRQFNTPAHVETGENLPPRPGDLQSLRTFPELGPIVQRQHIASGAFDGFKALAENGRRHIKFR